MPKKIEKMTNRAFTLVEVLVATLIFIAAAVPIYYAIAGGAGRGIETTKLSMARKILESFREEVMGRKYNELENLAGGSTSFVDMLGGYPKTLSDVIVFQRNYKDFEFSPKIRISPDRSTVLEISGAVTWTTGDGSKHKPEKLSFIVVKP